MAIESQGTKAESAQKVNEYMEALLERIRFNVTLGTREAPEPLTELKPQRGSWVEHRGGPSLGLISEHASGTSCPSCSN